MTRRYQIVGPFAHVLALALALSLTAPSIAQGAPQPLAANIVNAVQLDAEQNSTVCSYVDYYSATLADAKAKPEDVQKSRDELLRPLQGGNVSQDFRNTYSRCVLNKLPGVLTGHNIHASTNAIIVMSQLGTSRAIDELLGHCDRQLEPRWQIRLGAANGMASLLRAPSVEPRKILETIKRIRDAAKIEDNPAILGHLLAAIAIADSNALKDADDRKQVRDTLVDAVIAVIDRVAKGQNQGDVSPLIEPAQYWVGKIRLKYADPSINAELQTNGRKLGPALGQLLSVTASNWDAGHADDDSNKLFTQVVGTCEGFLSDIDKVVRKDASAPQTRLKDAWVANNKDKFTADLNQWLEVLKQPAYSKP